VSVEYRVVLRCSLEAYDRARHEMKSEQTSATVTTSTPAPLFLHDAVNTSTRDDAVGVLLLSDSFSLLSRATFFTSNIVSVFPHFEETDGQTQEKTALPSFPTK
jgi:hypothetical protein